MGKNGSISSDGGTFLKARFFLLKRTDTQQKRGEIREREGGVEVMKVLSGVFVIVFNVWTCRVI